MYVKRKFKDGYSNINLLNYLLDHMTKIGSRRLCSLLARLGAQTSILSEVEAVHA